jgi:hypothetical protein
VKRLSSLLRRIVVRMEDRIRLADVTALFGDRAFGALLLVFSVPNFVPLPPGGSTVLGTPLLLVAAQLALGRNSLWLPQRVGEWTLRKRDLQQVVDRSVPILRRTERLLAPRFGVLIQDRLIGAVCAVLAMILILPIPFGNMLPAFAVACFAMALVQRDGIAALVGWAATLASLVWIAAISGGAILAASAAIAWGRGLLGA